MVTASRAQLTPDRRRSTLSRPFALALLREFKFFWDALLRPGDSPSPVIAMPSALRVATRSLICAAVAGALRRESRRLRRHETCNAFDSSAASFQRLWNRKSVRHDGNR